MPFLRVTIFSGKDYFSGETLFSGETHFLREKRFSVVSFLSGNVFFGGEMNTLCPFTFADFCLCVSLNNLCTLSVQLFTIWKSLPFVEFAMFSRIFHPRGFVVNFLFKISGQKQRKIQPGEAGPYPLVIR